MNRGQIDDVPEGVVVAIREEVVLDVVVATEEVGVAAVVVEVAVGTGTNE